MTPEAHRVDGFLWYRPTAPDAVSRFLPLICLSRKNSTLVPALDTETARLDKIRINHAFKGHYLERGRHIPDPILILS